MPRGAAVFTTDADEVRVQRDVSHGFPGIFEATKLAKTHAFIFLRALGRRGLATRA
jgi:hypothetical protein